LLKKTYARSIEHDCIKNIDYNKYNNINDDTHNLKNKNNNTTTTIGILPENISFLFWVDKRILNKYHNKQKHQKQQQSAPAPAPAPATTDTQKQQI
jgi:hypothetical protein